jgi:hypothetical protein
MALRGTYSFMMRRLTYSLALLVALAPFLAAWSPALIAAQTPESCCGSKCCCQDTPEPMPCRDGSQGSNAPRSTCAACTLLGITPTPRTRVATRRESERPPATRLHGADRQPRIVAMSRPQGMVDRRSGHRAMLGVWVI